MSWFRGRMRKENVLDTWISDFDPGLLPLPAFGPLLLVSQRYSGGQAVPEQAD